MSRDKCGKREQRTLACIDTLGRLKPRSVRNAIVWPLTAVIHLSTLPFCLEYLQEVAHGFTQLLPRVREAKI